MIDFDSDLCLIDNFDISEFDDADFPGDLHFEQLCSFIQTFSEVAFDDDSIDIVKELQHHCNDEKFLKPNAKIKNHEDYDAYKRFVKYL